LLFKSNSLAGFLFPFYARESSTMVVQARNGENWLKAYRKHVYQLLAKERGIRHWKVSVGYGVFQVIVGLSVLAVRPFGLVAVTTILGFYFAGFFAFAHHVRKNVAPVRT
jgi:hypothetical protein